MAGLCDPLSTLRRCSRGQLRMTRGRCGSLLLHRDGLAPSTPYRSPGALRPDPLAGIGEIEHSVQLLTVVHGCVRRIPFADQLVHLVHAEVVLVAVEALVVLLRPARVLVLLGILGGLLLPSLRRLPGLDRLVLLLRVALLG